MNRFHAFMQIATSSVVKKLMIALTGAFLVFFLCIHLAGNLLFFNGAESFNGYARFLLTHYFIYPIEAILLFCILYHAISSIYIKYSNWRRARDTEYHIQKNAPKSRRNLATRLAPYTGIALFIFLVLHVWTMKFGESTPAASRDLWAWTLEMFSSPVVVALYMLAMIALGFHLFNGLGSLYESLGIAHRTVLRRIGQVFAVLLSSAFFLFPLVVYFFGEQF